jgi:MoxR-like ATPase
MEERQVTVDGVSRPLPDPFLVAATQNPVEYEGTYTLPEAQLDRFLMKTSLGYPDHEIAVALLMDSGNRARASKVTSIIASDAIATMAALTSEVHADESVMDYISKLATATRDDKDSALGVSMRGALALARAVRTWAIAAGRSYVIPDDVTDLAVAVLAHRIVVDPEAEFAGVTAEQIVERALSTVTPPATRAATALA